MDLLVREPVGAVILNNESAVDAQLRRVADSLCAVACAQQRRNPRQTMFVHPFKRLGQVCDGNVAIRGREREPAAKSVIASCDVRCCLSDHHLALVCVFVVFGCVIFVLRVRDV